MNEPPCKDPGCAVCNICKTGFDMSLSGKGINAHIMNLRYGQGLYFSSVSGKSNDYASGRIHAGKEYRFMFLTSVVSGRAFITKKGCWADVKSTHPSPPPPGYDSLVGEKGEDLNYDELVVYSNDAALPSFLVLYTVED